MLLSKDAILAANDLQYEDVHVPEWGGTVRVRALTGAERDAFEAKMAEARQKGMALGAALHNFRAKLVVRCIVDEQGKRLFSDDDAKALGTKSGAVLDRLFDVARRLSGMNEDAVEEAAKNSVTGQSAGSTSA